MFPINHPKSKKIIGVSLSLSLGIENLDSLLGGLSVGELVLLEGDSSALSLSHLLCVRSQLPEDIGGLGSSVVWIDGGNTFNPYSVAHFSRELGLSPEHALNNIYISRAFTCYQMSSLVLEKLWSAVERFGSRFVVISDLSYLYAESDIPRKEAIKAFAPVLEELSSSPNRGRVLILATILDRPFSGKAPEIKNSLNASADIVLSVRKRGLDVEARLRKHPSGRVGRVRFAFDANSVIPLEEFLAGDEVG